MKFSCKRESTIIVKEKFFTPARICQACGDGILHANEECDDFGTASNDGCSS